MKILYTAEVVATGGRDGHVRSSDGQVEFDLVAPEELGGPGGDGTNPEQLFAAGYAGCFSSALTRVARREKVDAHEATVTLRASLVTDDGGFGLAAEIDVELPGVERDQAESLVIKAHGVCPYSKATRGNIEVRLKVSGQALAPVAV